MAGQNKEKNRNSIKRYKKIPRKRNKDPKETEKYSRMGESEA